MNEDTRIRAAIVTGVFAVVVAVIYGFFAFVKPDTKIVVSNSAVPQGISTLPIATPVVALITSQPDIQCDTRLFVRESAAQGTEKTYIRCPVGEIVYSIQTDDLLTAISLRCPGSTPKPIGFHKNEQLSANEQLATFDSDRFISLTGCQVYITIANSLADQTGYWIRQEVVKSP